MKNVLIISDASPFDKQRIREALDMALIYAAIDQNVSWLFKGPAVLALKAQESISDLGLKNYFKSLKTLEIYDVENVYVCEASLCRYQLDSQSLIIDVQVVSSDAALTLIDEQDFVVTL
jgi:tRNA 2-thiouridine synthesizing protein C